MSEPTAFQYIFEGIPAIIKLKVRLWMEEKKISPKALLIGIALVIIVGWLLISTRNPDGSYAQYNYTSYFQPPNYTINHTSNESMTLNCTAYQDKIICDDKGVD